MSQTIKQMNSDVVAAEEVIKPFLELNELEGITLFLVTNDHGLANRRGRKLNPR
jgi:predicted ABC-type transport system involved in lysophospholipase L1 biosynthesis ATPase subunit